MTTSTERKRDVFVDTEGVHHLRHHIYVTLIQCGYTEYASGYDPDGLTPVELAEGQTFLACEDCFGAPKEQGT